MIQKHFILILIVLFISLNYINANDVSNDNTFYNFFQGKWNVQKSTIQLASGEQELDELLGFYSIEKDNFTDNLIGYSFDNDTQSGEITNEANFVIEFSHHNAGTFKVGQTKDADDMAVLFNFDFRTQHNGMLISNGEWSGEEGGYYQFIISSFDRFTITLIPKSSTSENAATILYTGYKIPEIKEKTFFQQYGMMLMMGGFFIFNMFVQSKTKAHLAQQQPAAARPTATAPVTESSGPKKNQ